MTQLLEQALAEVQKLPESEQDAIASLILDELADERRWEEAFAHSQDQLGRLAAKVREDIRAGRVSSVKVDELVNSQLTEDFLACFAKLPEAVKAQARKAYRLWRDNPSHPSLHFKRIHNHEALYSVRVSQGCRALGLLEGDTITWFWIGSHAEYEHLIR